MPGDASCRGGYGDFCLIDSDLVNGSIETSRVQGFSLYFVFGKWSKWSKVMIFQRSDFFVSFGGVSRDTVSGLPKPTFKFCTSQISAPIAFCTGLSGVSLYKYMTIFHLIPTKIKAGFILPPN